MVGTKNNTPLEGVNWFMKWDRNENSEMVWNTHVIIITIILPFSLLFPLFALMHTFTLSFLDNASGFILSAYS